MFQYHTALHNSFQNISSILIAVMFIVLELWFMKSYLDAFLKIYLLAKKRLLFLSICNLIQKAFPISALKFVINFWKKVFSTCDWILYEMYELESKYAPFIKLDKSLFKKTYLTFLQLLIFPIFLISPIFLFSNNCCMLQHISIISYFSNQEKAKIKIEKIYKSKVNFS